MDLLVLDQTRPDVGLPVVKVIVPGPAPFLDALRTGTALRRARRARMDRETIERG
jgi:ribosomal protein S12 methylthiotransferase accessory factor YcaO